MMNRKSHLLKILTAIVSLWLFGFLLFSSISIWRTPQKLNEITDAIVVLTGSDKRVGEGLMLFAAGKSKELFISGVHKDVTENEVRALWKGSAPVPECCITLGRRAVSTRENAIETRDWVQSKNFKSIRLVTANYHMNRALLNFTFIMPQIEIIPHPVEQPAVTPNKERFWFLIFSEYHKTLLQFFCAPFYFIESFFKS